MERIKTLETRSLCDSAKNGGLRGIDCTHEICLGGGIQPKGSGDTGDLTGGEHESKP